MGSDLLGEPEMTAAAIHAAHDSTAASSTTVTPEQSRDLMNNRLPTPHRSAGRARRICHSAAGAASELSDRGAAIAPLTRRLGVDPGAIVGWASAHASEWAAGAGRYTMSAAAGAGGALVSFAFIAVATFLLLRHGEALVATIPDLLPFERKRSEALLLLIRDVVHASMHGVVTIATIQGILCGGMFWLLGIPAAALWGFVTVFASVVPFVGTAAVWVPGTVSLLATGAWPKAIVLAVWGAAIVSSVDNLLRPKLVAGRVRLSGLAMFVAMRGSLKAFGALGIILGPALFATAAGIVDVLREMQPSHAVPADASEQQAGDRVLRESSSADSPHVRRGDCATAVERTPVA
jgi:predicted PurR-regulated permease PerM